MKLRQGMPIVIVEDSDDDFDTIQMMVRDACINNELHRANSGDDCLLLLRRDGVNAIHPAFVLMDLNVPGLDGREALKDIKDDPRLCTVPVVVFTSSSNPSDLTFCYEAGANAYHVKPLRYEDHVKTLRQVFDYWLDSVNMPGGEEFMK
jgi:CheY-like chemotaxis protein